MLDVSACVIALFVFLVERKMQNIASLYIPYKWSFWLNYANFLYSSFNSLATPS